MPTVTSVTGPASFNLGAFDSVLINGGQGTMAFTSLAPDVAPSHTDKLDNKTFGPFGAPMSVVLTVTSGSCSYTVIPDPSAVSGAGTLKILATRTGQNGAGGTFPQYASNTLMQHTLPYGAKSLQVVMSGTKASSDEAAIGPGLYTVDNIAINAGGTGHAVGDVVTGPSAGTTMVPFTVEVLAVSGGVITDVALVQPGAYTKSNVASAAAQQSASTGAGINATFAVRWKQAAFVANYGHQPDATDQATIVPHYAGFDARGARGINLVVPVAGAAAYDPVAVDYAAPKRIMGRSWTGGAAMSAGRRIAVGEQSNSAAGGTNYAQSGTLTLLTAGNYGLAAQPLAIIGRPASYGGTSLVIFGDSISHGVIGAATARDTMDANGNSGWIERGLADRIPFISYACPGDAAYRWTVNGCERRFAELEYLRRLGVQFDVAMVNFAVNDFTQAYTYAQFKANMVLLVNRLRALGFRKVGTVTGTPYATDATNVAANATVTPKMTAFHADLDSGGFAGIFDFFWDTRAYTYAPGTSLWQGGSTGTVSADAIHPTQATHIAMATAVRVSDLA